MPSAERPQWVVREDAGPSVLAALYLRQMLGIRSPEELPGLRGVRTDAPEADAVLERQWRALWAMTVEPLAHPSEVPLELIAGMDTLLALPADGADELRAAIVPHAGAALAFARSASAVHTDRVRGSSYRAYASAIAVHEREVGRRAHSFELNVQVLPLAQRGLWWIGSLTIAVTDGLRADVAAFDAAIHPIIAELA
ncbi:zinc-binding alcohol dehydrogenase [Microbacterium sp. Clip185]|uniref:zinc-binding alcohol dehydrogenase n=1 Tax=Microbacterium sp. Clip185 TaxID=3025663 RepID=UPI002365B39D|nr:zinc-binding alcohol dehydrogenase [Microbacterium sp. Clip185]WDG17938.1 zinc-binding alcohol dehydrogenase [Microbacterium sp. Clip185]